MGIPNRHKMTIKQLKAYTNKHSLSKAKTMFNSESKRPAADKRSRARFPATIKGYHPGKNDWPGVDYPGKGVKKTKTAAGKAAGTKRKPVKRKPAAKKKTKPKTKAAAEKPSTVDKTTTTTASESSSSFEMPAPIAPLDADEVQQFKNIVNFAYAALGKLDQDTYNALGMDTAATQQFFKDYVRVGNTRAYDHNTILLYLISKGETKQKPTTASMATQVFYHMQGNPSAAAVWIENTQHPADMTAVFNREWNSGFIKLDNWWDKFDYNKRVERMLAIVPKEEPAADWMKGPGVVADMQAAGGEAADDAEFLAEHAREKRISERAAAPVKEEGGIASGLSDFVRMPRGVKKEDVKKEEGPVDDLDDIEVDMDAPGPEQLSQVQTGGWFSFFGDWMSGGTKEEPVVIPDDDVVDRDIAPGADAIVVEGESATVAESFSLFTGNVVQRLILAGHGSDVWVQNLTNSDMAVIREAYTQYYMSGNFANEQYQAAVGKAAAAVAENHPVQPKIIRAEITSDQFDELISLTLARYISEGLTQSPETVHAEYRNVGAQARALNVLHTQTYTSKQGMKNQVRKAAAELAEMEAQAYEEGLKQDKGDIMWRNEQPVLGVNDDNDEPVIAVRRHPGTLKRKKKVRFRSK